MIPEDELPWRGYSGGSYNDDRTIRAVGTMDFRQGYEEAIAEIDELEAELRSRNSALSRAKRDHAALKAELRDLQEVLGMWQRENARLMAENKALKKNQTTI